MDMTLDLDEELQLSIRAREIARLPADQLTAALIALLRQQRLAEIWIDAIASEVTILRRSALRRPTDEDRRRALVTAANIRQRFGIHEDQLTTNPVGERFRRWWARIGMATG